eukprot:NODE_6700_length_544_cov_2.600000_g6278_i0.p2 GENE.NODE_6700_length_544_cov_2.600000_g6278_i0~~NODE_6700_length_544_cov_2.600000_g6278_i0.p2  ORF type:complete len:123 (+),score=11.78 NODE_6700_length_544_cov_2.600000_g6278_i0:85-453(+)
MAFLSACCLLLLVASLLLACEASADGTFFKGGPQETCHETCRVQSLECDEDLSGFNIEKVMSKMHKCGQIFKTLQLPFEPIWDWRHSCIGTALTSLQCSAKSSNPADSRLCKCIKAHENQEL